MGWWSNFDLAEVEADFARIAACGLDSVRVFLTWEDFQPAPDRVDQRMLERLVAVADLAGGLGLELIPTLFTGHMSGVNWIPAWALGGSGGDRRFRVVSGGAVVHTGLRNWYSDSAIGDAQALMAGEAAAALAGHEAVWAWDLGNENSNCVIPPTRASARAWLDRLCSAIRRADETALVTVGLHMEDLEEDRLLGPPEASEACDLLTMHGYPIYASWADGPTDAELLPFLARMTYWLGEGRDVLFSEFGLPTYRRGDPHEQSAGATLLVEEDAAAAYTTLLEALKAEGKFREGSRVAEEMLGVVKSNYARSIAYFQRASTLAEMGEDLDAALELADLSLKLSPKEMRQFPLAAKGWVHYKRREYDRAVECLRRATDLGETPTGLTHLGLAYLAVGDARAARQAFGRAKRRDMRVSAGRSLEAKMLEQIRRNLQLTEKLANRGRSRARERR